MKRCLFLVLVPTPALAIDDVLMLGNSYIFTQDLDVRLADILVEGGEETTVHALTSGGLTLADHAQRAQDPTSEWYQALVTQATDREWVILQDQSQIPGFPAHSSYWQDSLAGAETLDSQVEAAEAETMFFLTWGRREGDSTNASLYPDFSTMQALLNQGYLAYQEATSTGDRPTWIAPVGPAFARVHDDILAEGGDPLSPDSLFWGLYTNDGSHPSPLGTYLAACVFYSTLTGESPVGLNAPADIEEALAVTLQEAAAMAVFEDTDWLSYPWQEATGPSDTGQLDSGGTDSADPDTANETGGESGSTDDPEQETETATSDPCGCTAASSGSGLFLLGMLGAWRRRRQTVPRFSPPPAHNETVTFS